ncbi:MAG: DUF447 domain-containing protein [Halodesulfurarchaeum sp.]
MTGNDGREPMTAQTGWPVELTGVVETVTTTRQSTGRWNVAALGLHADDDPEQMDSVRARTWGKTRTRRNFERTGAGYVQFTRDPVVFAEAALAVREADDPVLDTTAAWVEVTVDEMERGTRRGTEWVDWRVTPIDSHVRERMVPVTSRAFGAIVEMTVAASRLSVAAYDDSDLQDRLEYFADVVERTGGPREKRALESIETHSEWDGSRPENGERSGTEPGGAGRTKSRDRNP